MIEQKHVEFPPRRLANSPFSYAHVIPMITVISHFSALQMFPRELLGLKAKRNNFLWPLVHSRIEWLYFRVFKFSRNAKDFTAFFAKFRENCESKKTSHIGYLSAMRKRALFSRYICTKIAVS